MTQVVAKLAAQVRASLDLLQLANGPMWVQMILVVVLLLRHREDHVFEFSGGLHIAQPVQLSEGCSGWDQLIDSVLDRQSERPQFEPLANLPPAGVVRNTGVEEDQPNP